MRNRVEAFLPLHVTTAWALAKLAVEPQHAYVLGQAIGELMGRNVPLSDLIPTLHRLQNKGLIEPVGSSGARGKKTYALTDLGWDVLVADTRRLLMRIHYINEIVERQKNK